MGCGLQFDFGKVRNRVLAAARHLSHLFEDDIVQSGRVSGMGSGNDAEKCEGSFQREILWRQASPPANRAVGGARGLA